MKKIIFAAMLALGLFGLLAIVPFQTHSTHASVQVADGPPNPLIVTHPPTA